jgi:hypothetical protein
MMYELLFTKFRALGEEPSSHMIMTPLPLF